MTNKILVLIATLPLGIYCLLFTSHAVKIISVIMQLSSRFGRDNIDPDETLARPSFVRIIGIANIAIGLLVYLGGAPV